MGIFRKKPVVPANPEKKVDELPATWLAVLLGGIASLGGFLFGYESGMISGKCG